MLRPRWEWPQGRRASCEPDEIAPFHSRTCKRADRVKLLFWDGTGVCLLAMRLEGGKFCWPKMEDGVMRLSPAPLSALSSPWLERSMMLRCRPVVALLRVQSTWCQVNAAASATARQLSVHCGAATM